MTDERNVPPSRRVDVSRLPADVVDLINALGPGEDLVITKDGAPLATISSSCDVFDRAPTAAGTPDEPPMVVYDDVTVVATAMKLSASARTSLSAELGADYIVLDMHAAPATADVLLVPPGSPQMIWNLRSMFPRARVIVTEIEDDVLGVSYRGPIRRMLDAGAETYLAATTVPRLARQLDHAVTQRQHITGGSAPRLAIEPSAEPPHSSE